MVDQLTIQTIGVLVAATSVVAFVINSILTSRREEKRNQSNLETRQAQLLMQIFDQINNREFKRDYDEVIWGWKFKDYDEYFKEYGVKPERFSKLSHIIDTLEGVGTILENRLVDPKMLSRVLQYYPLLAWEKYGPIVREFGRRTGESMMYPGFEFLYREMSMIYEREHGHRFNMAIRSYDDLRVTTER